MHKQKVCNIKINTSKNHLQQGIVFGVSAIVQFAAFGPEGTMKSGLGK
jgi:hypothetical protein